MSSVLRWQASFCHRSGSPLYGSLLDRSADDVDAAGVAWTVLQPFSGDPPTSALALRFMAAVHRLVLQGVAPELAAIYPTTGGSGDPQAGWPAFRGTLEAHAGELSALISQPCQTNEVGRSAALLPGFLAIAREASLPLRLLEIGTSGGLNLRWDRYRYEGAGLAWGDPASPVRITNAFGGPLPLGGSPEVAQRRGCDPTPLDPTRPEDRLRLQSSVWADRPERLERLSAAFDVAASTPARIDRANAGPWLADRLAEPAAGMTTVVFHSVVLQYLEEAERRRVFGLIESAGSTATPDAPVAWLRFESGDWRRTASHEVRLRRWPGGQDRKLAESGPHGPPVRWTAG